MQSFFDFVKLRCASLYAYILQTAKILSNKTAGFLSANIKNKTAGFLSANIKNKTAGLRSLICKNLFQWTYYLNSLLCFI